MLVMALLLGACGTNRQVPEFTSPDSRVSSTTDVVLLGAVQKSGLKAPVSASVMAADIEKLIAGERKVSVTPAATTRQIIGESPHDEMMAFYARNARFAPYQVQRLMAANLPARKALVVRLEADSVLRLPMIREALVDEWGRVIADRERRTYITRRVTQLSASLLDLRNGRVIWTRQYRVSPEVVAASNHHTGESFGASVAAAVANTLVQGIRDTDYPNPPSLGDSVYALLQEVATNAPVR